MGFSYAVDMINRMKQERSRNNLNKKKAKHINNTIKLNIRYPKKIKNKPIATKELESIKVEIRKKLKLERKRNYIIYSISTIIGLIVIYYYIISLNNQAISILRFSIY